MDKFLKTKYWTKKARRVHSTWPCLYWIQNKAKLIYAVASKDSGYLCYPPGGSWGAAGEAVSWLSNGYTDVFSLWKIQQTECLMQFSKVYQDKLFLENLGNIDSTIC